MGADKALLPVEGTPLVVRVAERLSLVARPVLLAPGMPGRLGRLGYPEVADAVPGGGPLAGLVAGLEASPHPLTAVVAVDMPLVSPEVFRLLAALRGDEDAVVPVTARGLQPLHAIYARSALPVLRAALEEGRLALRAALQGLRVREVGEDEWCRADPAGTFALNVNTAADLARVPRGPRGTARGPRQEGASDRV